MPSVSMSRRDESALPPLPSGHGYAEGDRVSLPVWGTGVIQGTVTWVDITFGAKRYKGLVVLGDDRRYYELDPSLTHKLPDLKSSKT